MVCRGPRIDQRHIPRQGEGDDGGTGSDGHAGSNRQNGNRAAPVTLVLRYAARSDRGLVRTNNEDSVYAGARLLALADGMGGHAAGEGASQLVIAALAPLHYTYPDHHLLDTPDARVARVGHRYPRCPDGLSDPVSQETNLESMKIPDVAESADRLIELALRGGGPDNVTVVVADVVDYDLGQTQPILAGAVSGGDDQAAPPNTAAGRASAFNPRRGEPPKRPAAEPAAP